MRGVGGPLLSIGDLLNDIGEPDDVVLTSSLSTLSYHPHPDSFPDLHPDHLSSLFQENYEQLKVALAGTDHSWAALTLKLCTALETADKLVESTNSHVSVLSDNIRELEKVVKRGDSAIADAKSLLNILMSNEVPVERKLFAGSDHTEV